jgi:hypothetical protein
MAKEQEEIQTLREQLAKRDAQLDRMLAMLEARPAPAEVGSAIKLTEDQNISAHVADLKGTNRPRPRERLLPFLSPESNATMLLRVIESKGYPDGRIVDLLEYTYPEGFDVYQHAGGLVPDGLQMTRPDNGHKLPKYNQWLYDTFWKRDLNAYVGRPMSRRYVDPEILAMPWTQPVVALPEET